MNEAYLCLGGNLGDCTKTFTKVGEMLTSLNIIINCKSNIYKSAAWGMGRAPDFYNQVLQVKTVLAPDALLEELLAIEKKLGRERKPEGTYESRTIDIDILFFNDNTITKKHLHIPHPRIQERRFALEPMNEIAPNFIHPLLKKNISQLLKDCTDTSKVERTHG